MVGSLVQLIILLKQVARPLRLQMNRVAGGGILSNCAAFLLGSARRLPYSCPFSSSEDGCIKIRLGVKIALE